jgi:hypothetical protein
MPAATLYVHMRCSHLCSTDADPLLTDSPFWVPCRNLAKSRMLAALQPCDLELLRLDPECCQMLITLPYEVLLELLNSHETRVAAESTVASLITLWLAFQPQPATAEQQQQLARCIRLRGMPRYYLEQVGHTAAAAVHGMTQAWQDAAATLWQQHGPANSALVRVRLHVHLPQQHSCR